MEPREPAGWERGKGKSAESIIRARMMGGSAGNTRGTVCGRPRVRYPLTELDAKGRAWTVGRSVPLPTLFFVWKSFRPAVPERFFFRHASSAILDINKLCLRLTDLA